MCLQSFGGCWCPIKEQVIFLTGLLTAKSAMTVFPVGLGLLLVNFMTNGST